MKTDIACRLTVLGVVTIAICLEVVSGVENTRAAGLSWQQDAVREFNSEMRERLGAVTEVALTRETTLRMARIRTDR